MLMSTTTIAVPTTAVLAARYIAETNAFLNEYWDCPFARWPLKQQAAARVGVQFELQPAGAADVRRDEKHPTGAIACWTLLCLPALAAEPGPHDMPFRLVLVFREPESPPPAHLRLHAGGDVWEMQLGAGTADHAIVVFSPVDDAAPEGTAPRDRLRLRARTVTALLP